MKMSLEWHRKKLLNVRSSLESAEKRLAYAKADYDRTAEFTDLCERQVAEAERRGLDGFDGERFLVSRKKVKKVPQMNFPDHKAALHLTHNEHLNYYQTVQQSIDRGDHGYRDWVSEDQKKKAVETNDCWYIQWYPNTPVGFRLLAAADLDVLLEASRQ